MVNNQIEFNNKYSKEEKEIELKYKKFQGQLVIKDYSELQKLYLRRTGNIDKIILKNLTQLQECTIWNCGTKDLIIENCPQIKKLNVPNNHLTNLEFLKNLKNLEKLEIDDNTEITSGLEHLPDSLEIFSCENTKLTKILSPYNRDWKSYKKDIRELIELAKQNPQRLLEKINKLKKKELVSIDNSDDFKKKYQKLKGTLNFLIKEEELKSKELDRLITDDLIKGIEKQKENLYKLQKIKKELEKKLDSFEQLYLAKKEKIEQKEKELEELKITYLEKAKNYEKAKEKINELLECQSEIIVNDSEYVRKRKNEIRGKITQKTKITIEELDKTCQLQTEIAQLKLELQKKINEVVNKYETVINGDVIQSIVGVEGDIEIGGSFSPKIEEIVAQQQHDMYIPKIN